VRSSNNPTRKSDLPSIDVFVSTAEPKKEPPLVIANTILFILVADYSVEKLSCYFFDDDDGGALLTFEGHEIAEIICVEHGATTLLQLKKS